MKVLTAEQMRSVDARAEEHFGISSSTLMDNAGARVAGLLMALYPDLAARGLLIVCGKGNNGGDGLAAARHLKRQGVAARVVLLARASELTGAAAHHHGAALKAKVVVEEIRDEGAWKQAIGATSAQSIVLDAILGTGLSGPARGPALTAIADLNGSDLEVVSVDIPSGLSGDTGDIVGAAVGASHTIALCCPKVSHVLGAASALCGRLHIADIGIPWEAVEAEEITLNILTEEEAAALVPVREADTHKGSYGRVLVVAGSRGRSGAAAMVCLGALRAGAGLVTAATSDSAQPLVAAHAFEVMTEALPETHGGALSQVAEPMLRDLMASCDVLALGPGLMSGHETAALVRQLVSSSQMPLVLDADGLNAFGGRAAELNGEQRVLILTPHPGEMARLLSHPAEPPVSALQVQADRIGIVRAFAKRHHCYLVLKGHRTAIADPGGQVWINTTGNPGMATAGAGDLLTGIIAGLLAQGLSPMEAVLLGVYAHGMAGDLAADDTGEISLMARDILEALPDAFQQLDGAPPRRP